MEVDELPLTEMEAANLRHEHFMADAARAERARTVDALAAPLRAVGDAARAVGEATGLVTPPGTLPTVFDPVDAGGKRLATAVRTQPSLDLRCTAYAVASMMEIWWCRQQQSSDGVPHLSIEATFSGKADLVETAKKAAKGVVDVSFSGPIPEKPKGPNAWKLEWRSLRGPLKDRPEAMCRALVDDGPLAISIDIFDDFHSYVEDAPGKVYTPGPTAVRRLDAHALCIVGYDRDARTWLVRNSNEAWGRGGYGRIAWADEKVRPEFIVVGVTKVIHPVN